MNLYSVNKIAGLILLALFFISQLDDFPVYLSTILSFCWFLYVPYTIGNLFLKLPLKQFNKVNSSIDFIGIAGKIINWFIGIFIISTIVYLLFTINVDIIYLIGPLLLLVSIGFNFVKKPSKSLQPLEKYRLRIILILIVGISFGLYIRSFSPYPLSPGIDVFNHMFVIESILDNSPSNSPLVYFPTFDLMIALGSSTFDADLNSVFWMGSVFLSMLFSLSCYTLLYYFLRNNLQATFGTIIALPLTEMGFATNLQFFYPASFVMSIFPLMFFCIDYLWKKLVQSDKKVIAITLSIVIFSVLMLMHTYIGLIASILLSLYIFCYYYLSNKYRLFFIFRMVTVTLALVLVAYSLGYLTFQFEIDFIQSNMFESYHLYDTFTKIKNLEEWYTKEILLASIIGSIVLSFHKNKNIVILNFIGIVTFLTYFQQISDIHRIMPLERWFIALTAISTITLPIIILARKVKFSNLFNKRIKKIESTTISDKSAIDISNSNDSIKSKSIIGSLRSIVLTDKLGLLRTYQTSPKLFKIYVVVVFVLLFPVLMGPYDDYIGTYLSQGYDFTNYTFDELSASIWIKENIPKDYKIYSDPSTVIEMRGLAYRTNIAGIGWNTTTAYDVRSVLLSENATYAYQNIIVNHGDDTVIVITPRTSEWIRGNLFFVQLPIKEFRFFDGIEKFFDENYFKLEYYNDSVMVFTLRPH